MGLGISRDGQVQQLYEFRKLSNAQDNFEIPERPENRRVTDRKYLIAFIVVLILLVPFLVYTLLNVQLKQLSGSDNCGNFCGYKNEKHDDIVCSGQDFTTKPYQFLKGYYTVSDTERYRERDCVDSCPSNYRIIFHTCVFSPSNSSNSRHPNNDDEMSLEALLAVLGDIGRDIGRGWWAILLSAVVSCLLCFGTMSLFRYAVDFLVWFILLGSIGILAIIAGLFWYAYFQFKNHPNLQSSTSIDVNNNGATGFMVLAIVFSIIVACLIIVITCMVKRVKLIIQLFKEASKAIFDIPSLILMPVWTSLLVTLCFVVFIILTFFMGMAGKLTQITPNHYEYTQNAPMAIALVYNIVTYIWVTEFIIGAQYIIIAGSVSAWFFTRNKHYLDSPLWTAFTNFTNFHLGTVAIGSLIITIMMIIRALIRGLANNQKTRWLIDCCLANVEEFLRFLSKNAYIQTAMHGQPFFKSGKRAAKLLVSNAANVIAVNSIGDFVLVIAQLLLVVVCSVAGVFLAKATGVTHYWAIAVICVFIAICMAATFFAIFENLAMGIGYSNEGNVQQLFEFRHFQNDQEEFEIPEKPENRKVTDRQYLIAFIVVLILLIPFLVYAISNVQLKQISGSDNCGNFCGYVNEKHDDEACSGQDYTMKPYQRLLIGSYTGYEGQLYRKRECVSDCPDDFSISFQTCTPNEESNTTKKKLTMEIILAFIGDVGGDIVGASWVIVLSTIITCLLCFGTFSLFRYHVEFLVWFILYGSIGATALVAIFCWYMYLSFIDDPYYAATVMNRQNDASTLYIVFALTLSASVIVLIFVMTCMMKRVKLIIQLFKEASKAIYDIPSLIMMPIWVSILVLVCFMIYAVLTFLILMAGKLELVAPHHYEYQSNALIITTLIYNIFTFIWITEFMIGAQYIIIAGAVSAWFFTREKQNLNRPLWTSFTIFKNFHLGTVAIGSLIVTIVTFIRSMIKAMSRKQSSRWLVECCLVYVEEFLRYLSKNAYIQTAMHGQSFFKSGKRAVDLLVSNASNVIAINSIGDFVLCLAELLLVTVSGGIGFLLAWISGVTYFWVIGIICVAIAAFMARTFFAIFEATIDCIFICFCEDTTLNDGMARPYFMSKGLMQFIEDSKFLRVES